MPQMAENQPTPSTSKMSTESVSAPPAQDPQPSLFTKVYKCALCQTKIDGFNPEARNLEMDMQMMKHCASDRSCFLRMRNASVRIMEDGDPDPDFVLTYYQCNIEICKNKESFPKSEQQQHVTYHRLAANAAKTGGAMEVTQTISSTGLTERSEGRGTAWTTPPVSKTATFREKKRSESPNPVQPAVDIQREDEDEDIMFIEIIQSPARPHLACALPSSSTKLEKKTLEPTPNKQDNGADKKPIFGGQTSAAKTAPKTPVAVPKPASPAAASPVNEVPQTFRCHCGFTGEWEASRKHFVQHHVDKQPNLCFICKEEVSEDLVEHMVAHLDLS